MCGVTARCIASAGMVITHLLILISTLAIATLKLEKLDQGH
jgi:hypothetical protein